MRNYYSCGCYTADDVPVVSRCGIHNGWVIARTNFRITNPRLLKVNKRVKVYHHNMLDVLPNLKRQIDFMFLYPEPELFAPTYQMSSFGWRTHRMEEFAHFARLLADGGKAVLIIDTIDMATCIYQAELHGFEVHWRFTPVTIKQEPLHPNFWKSSTPPQLTSYKVAVGLNTGPLPRMRVTKLGELCDALDVPEKGRVLDASCIFLNYVQMARPESEIIGIVEDVARYHRFLDAPALGAYTPSAHSSGRE